MTAPQGAGGSSSELWLDMSRYPDTDPDTVLTADEHDVLASSLAVDDDALPEAVWEHMLAVVTGETGDDTADADTDGGDSDDAVADDDVLAANDGWSADLTHAFGLDTEAPGDPGHDPAADPAGDHDVHEGWDGGPA